MKKLSFTLIIMVIAINLIYSYEFFEQFEMRRLTSNFFGSIYNHNSLLVYGDGGIILRTTNFGRNWEQIELNDSLAIIGMINIGSKFYGISKYQYIIVSSDGGIKWKLKDFGKDARFFRIFYFDSSIVVISRGKVLFFTKELTKIREVEIPKKGDSYNDNYLTSLELVGNSLVFQYSSNELCLVSLLNGNYQLIEIPRKNPGDTLIKQIIPTQTNVFVYFSDDSFYRFDPTSSKIEFLNTLSQTLSKIFSAYKDNVYLLCNYYINTYNIDSLFFGRFDLSKTSFEKINSDSVERFFNELNFTDLKFISQDTIVAVGKNKLIMISFDGGQNWTLHSLFNYMRTQYHNSYLLPFLIDKKYLRVFGNFFSFFSSNDSGNTWLPPKLFKLDFAQNKSFLAYSGERLGVYLSSDKGIYFSETMNIKEPNFAYTTDGGNNFAIVKYDSIGHQNTFTTPQIIRYKDEYIWVTSTLWFINNHWEIYTFFRKFEITPNGLRFERIASDTSVQFLFIHNINDTLYAIIQKELTHEYSDTLFVYCSYDGARNWDSLYPIVIKRRTSGDFFIGPYYKFGDTILIGVSFWKDEPDPINNILSSLYQLDLRKGVFKEVLALDSSWLGFDLLSKLGKYYFILGMVYKNRETQVKYFFTKDYTRPVSEWKEITINPRYSSRTKYETRFNFFTNQLFGHTSSLPLIELPPNTLLVRAFLDTYHNTEVVFLAKLKENSIFWQDTIDVDSIDTDNFDIFVTPPYPTPSTESIKFRVYFNPMYNFDQIGLSGWDILGRKIAGENSFEIQPINQYSAEIKWNLGNTAQGTYFILVRLGNSVRKIPVVILK